MRVIAGSLGGRSFDSPRGHHTHPMSDRVRGALFNTLGDISGLTVLDAFAGSGALSFEAVSRGAARATAIEPDRSAQTTINKNIDQLDLEDQVKLIQAKAQSWLSTTDLLFDLVLCDPPYDAISDELLARLATRTESGGTIVLSLPPGHTPKLTADCKLLQKKDYGDATLLFYRREAT